MLSWWVWAIIIFLILLILFKIKEVRHKIGLVFIAGILIFLIFSMTQVYSSNNVDLTSFDGIMYAGKIYLNWLGGLFHNVIRVSDYAVHQNWGINSTNVSR